MKNSIQISVALLFVLCLVPGNTLLAKNEPDKKVHFISPKNGATVDKTFKVKFGLKGMKVRPAGEDPTDKTTGHHHIIVDAGAVAEGEIIPSDVSHIHFGKGQTETELTLPPGEHTLTMQFADGLHKSYGEKMSSTIKIKVKE